MIVFFDIMLLDDTPVLHFTQHKRRRILESIVRSLPDHATMELAEYQLIDFSKRTATQDFRRLFAKCITARHEGLIMKPAGDSYFSTMQRGSYHSCCIKLKKEYLGRNFREVGDFAIIGAAYDAQRAKLIPIPDLPWTDFYVGCLENKVDVIEKDAVPRFTVITTVAPNKDILRALKRMTPASEPFRSDNSFLRLERGVAEGKKPSVIFTNPLVFDLYCFSFCKESNTGFWTLRFPQVSKIHFDRTYMDTMTFAELQHLASAERSDIERHGSQEDREWVEMLEAADFRGKDIDEISERGSPTPSPAILPLRSASVVSLESLNRDPKRALQNLKKRSSARSLDSRQTSPKRIKLWAPDAPHQSPFGRSESTTPFIPSVEQHHSLSEIPISFGLLQSATPCRGPEHCVHEKAAFSETQSDTIGTPDPITLHKHKPRPVFCPSLIKGQSKISCTDREREVNITKDTMASPLEPCSPTIPLQVAHSLPVERKSHLLINCSVSLSFCNVSLRSLWANTILSHGGSIVERPNEWFEHPKFPSHSRISGGKFRKLIIVERSATSSVVRLLHTIQAQNLKRQSGQREWVEVYDSRLLQQVVKLQTSFPIPSGIWKRHWVGAI